MISQLSLCSALIRRMNSAANMTLMSHQLRHVHTHQELESNHADRIHLTSIIDHTPNDSAYHHPFRNQIIVARTDSELDNIRQLKSKLFHAQKMTRVQMNDSHFLFRHGLTFTPYAFATICNANCKFCSENLERKVTKKNSSPSKRIRDYDQYFNGLERAFSLLDSSQQNGETLSMGLSLSGLEATSEPNWLTRMCTLLAKYPSLFDEKVMYSNGSGFALHEDKVVSALKLLTPLFDRIELSRQHFDEQVNQSIMRFEKVQPIRYNKPYEHVVRHILPGLFGVVKNSCILTKEGISNVSLIEQYLQWAISLNVQRVVFRELSVITDDGFTDNTTKKWIDDNRVTVKSILSVICPSLDNPYPKFKYLNSTVGYYYMNECYRYDNKIDVIFETSSYEDLASSLEREPNLVNKLIFHPNGNLTSDWEQNSHVLGNFFHDDKQK